MIETQPSNTEWDSFTASEPWDRSSEVHIIYCPLAELVVTITNAINREYNP